MAVAVAASAVPTSAPKHGQGPLAGKTLARTPASRRGGMTSAETRRVGHVARWAETGTKRASMDLGGAQVGRDPCRATQRGAQYGLAVPSRGQGVLQEHELLPAPAPAPWTTRVRLEARQSRQGRSEEQVLGRQVDSHVLSRPMPWPQRLFSSSQPTSRAAALPDPTGGFLLEWCSQPVCGPSYKRPQQTDKSSRPGLGWLGPRLRYVLYLR